MTPSLVPWVGETLALLLPLLVAELELDCVEMMPPATIGGVVLLNVVFLAAVTYPSRLSPDALDGRQSSHSHSTISETKVVGWELTADL